MIGLNARQSKLYDAIVALFEERQRSLTWHEVSRATGLMPYQLNRKSRHSVLAPLIKRKFVGVSDDGRIVPWTPPHGVVVCEVCDKLSVSPDDVRGPSKLPKLVRARRMITRRLRNEYHYEWPAIAELLNRHRGTIEDYYSMTRASRRSKERVERFRAQNEREMRLAA